MHVAFPKSLVAYTTLEKEINLITNRQKDKEKKI